MPILFHGTVAKAASRDDILKLLRSFLDQREKSLVRILVRFWDEQKKAITYKDIREAILNGALDIDKLTVWQEDYAVFVAKILAPEWAKAMNAGMKQLKERFPGWEYDVTSDRIARFVSERSGLFVTNCAQNQLEALNELLKMAVDTGMPADQLSRAIRPLIGLTKRQAATNFQYYCDLRAGGTGHKAALDKCIRLAGKQHRYRAMNIARTELAWAYNKGEYAGVKQAQAENLLGDLKKVWCTAEDERVCSICGELDGQEAPMEGSFQFPGDSLWAGFKETPPAHNGCRCVLLYIEIKSPFGAERR